MVSSEANEVMLSATSTSVPLVPLLPVHEKEVIPEGIGQETLTLLAGSGPLLVTSKV